MWNRPKKSGDSVGEAGHTAGLAARLWVWLGSVPHRLAHHFRVDSRATLFSAALAVIATHIGALRILVKLSLMIVANMAAQVTPILDGAGPVVLLLSESRWQDRYYEHSPLDRCTLAEDMTAMLAHAPRTLAVDFDLSPSLRPQDAACQTRLDDLLDRHAKQLVVLTPFRITAPHLIAEKRDWMLSRCRAGVAFADGSLETSLGMVIDSVPGHDRMAEVVRQREHAGICAAIATAAGSQKWLARDDTVNGAIGETEPVAINFAHFRQQANRLSLDDLPGSTINDWPQRDVFFGGDYGASGEDQFRTPIGPLPGIAVHAARYLTLDRPVAELQPMAGFAIDILIAFIFSIGIAYFWRLYARWRLAQTPSHRQLASVVVIGFLGFYVLLVLLFFALSTDLFAVGILIAPLLIAVSMLVDGFITGPVAAILSQAGQAGEESQDAGDFLALLLTMGIVGVALHLLHPSPTAPTRVAIMLVLAAMLIDRALSLHVTDLFESRRGPLGASGHHRHRHLNLSASATAMVLLLGVVGATVLTRVQGLTFSYTGTAVFFTVLVCISVAMLAGLLGPVVSPLGGWAAAWWQRTGFQRPAVARATVSTYAGPAINVGVSPASPDAPIRSHLRPATLFRRLFGTAPVMPQRWPQRAAVLVAIARKCIFWSTLCWALAFLLHS